jgi:hypothetical protein
MFLPCPSLVVERSVGMKSAVERLKELGGTALGLMCFLAVLLIPVVFILGGVWAAKHLLYPLIVIGWFLVAIDILILLPLSIFRSLRGFTGAVIFISSFIFATVTWLLGFILTYALWGFWAVVIGILLFGGTVVPFAMLATVFEGMWEPFCTLLVLLIVTFGSRVVGASIAESTA